MDDLDEVLREAGARWRASQAPPPEIDDYTFPDVGRRTIGWQLVAAGLVGASAGAGVIVLLAFGLIPRIVQGPPVGPGARAATASVSPAIGTDVCAVTQPNPPLAAPSPYPSSPPDGRSAWFGTPRLWTRLDPAGEIWKGTDQKTFWWSSDWPGQRAEPEPPIRVMANRLDGPGTVTGLPGTNASADDLGGQAMLVGIEFPSPGCWQLTAQYRGAVLSYVVWIK
jgi:hypothetical protein